MKALLHRYWFEFERGPLPPGAVLGCGVTAFDEADARALLASTVFRDRAFPRVRRLIQDVGVSTLDAGHVLPNMLDSVIRGVWFPMGRR